MVDSTRAMQLLGVVLALGVQGSLAFVSSRAGRSSSIRSTTFVTPPCGQLNALPSELLSLTSSTDSTVSSLNPSSPSSLLLSLDLVELSKTIGLTILGVFAFFTIFTFVTVNVLMPAAAKQVETLTKEYDPALWDEYLQKLQPGETMATRPDLMQELGQKVLTLQDRQFQQHTDQGAESSQREPDVLVDPKPRSSTTTSSSSTSSSAPIDVEVMDRNQWDD